MPRISRWDLLNKRAFGYVNWHRGRKLVHRRDILDTLTRDIVAQNPDHIAVTGDLVNLGLPEEFIKAAKWLHELGAPHYVTAIPGNHDTYVRLHPEEGTRHWGPYMQSNEAGEALFATPPTCFPFVRRFGEIALIALSSAIPTMAFVAAGKLGKKQRRFLSDALETIGRESLFRVVLIHHPPLPEQSNWRRGLRDAKKLRAILQDKGAELVLHGHDHEASVLELDTSSGPAFVIGVPSASEAIEGGVPAARYNEYRIARVNAGWSCEMIGRAVAREPGQVSEIERRILRAE